MRRTGEGLAMGIAWPEQVCTLIGCRVHAAAGYMMSLTPN